MPTVYTRICIFLQRICVRRRLHWFNAPCMLIACSSEKIKTLTLGLPCKSLTSARRYVRLKWRRPFCDCRISASGYTLTVICVPFFFFVRWLVVASCTFYFAGIFIFESAGIVLLRLIRWFRFWRERILFLVPCEWGPAISSEVDRFSHDSYLEQFTLIRE